MSKKPSSKAPIGVTSGPNDGGYMYYTYEMNDLFGRIMTTVESFGLRETQEKAAKDMLRFHFNEFWSRMKYVVPDEADAIARRHYESIGSTSGSNHL